MNPTLDPKYCTDETAIKLPSAALLEVFKTSTASRERDFEIGQRAMLERALKAEAALQELIDVEKASRDNFNEESIWRIEQAIKRGESLLSNTAVSQPDTRRNPV